MQSSSPPRLPHSSGLQPQRLWFRPATLGLLCQRLSRLMFNRSDIGTTVTADGATIIAARGGTAIAVMAITDSCRGFTAGAAGIAIVTTVIIKRTGGGVSRRPHRRKIMTRLYLVACVAALLGFSATSATAHVVPWRDGESRMKGFGHCAKGPCMKRYDFGSSKPHHHHGNQVMMGSNRHTAQCGYAVR